MGLIDIVTHLPTVLSSADYKSQKTQESNSLERQELSLVRLGLKQKCYLGAVQLSPYYFRFVECRKLQTMAFLEFGPWL